jgi:hypothetical protein
MSLLSIFDKKIENKRGHVCEAQTNPQHGVVRKHARISGEECWKIQCCHGNRITTRPTMQGQKTGSFQVAFDRTSSSS